MVIIIGLASGFDLLGLLTVVTTAVDLGSLREKKILCYLTLLKVAGLRYVYTLRFVGYDSYCGV